MTNNDHIECPLCKAREASFYATGPLKRDFYLCAHCYLLFTTKSAYPSPQHEKARYETHDNSPEEPGYLKFLNNAVQPALEFLKPGMHGLDYGSGPGPAISVMLEKEGISCDHYDSFFAPGWKEGPFDFIFCTETAEHFFNPAKELQTIDENLKPGGYLIVMTRFWEESVDFSNWGYARDQTHVCFYHQKTMAFLAKKYNWTFLYNDDHRVIIYQKGY